MLLDMSHLIDLLYEYRLLQAKRELQVPLEEAEQARLDRLAQLLRNPADPSPGRRRMPRARCELPVQLTSAGSFGAGRMHDVSGDGMGMRTSLPVEPGSELLVHVRGSGIDVEHVFPARVVWRRQGLQPAIGLAFRGAPWRLMPPQGIGSPQPRRRRATPLVA